MGFETFNEGACDEMFSGVDVAHVLARTDVAFGINHLTRSEIECEALSGARHMIERRWGRVERRRGGRALGFAVTFPEEDFGGEQMLGEAHMDVVVVEDIVEKNDIFCRDFVEEDVGFGVAGVRCRWCERAVSVVVPQYVPMELKVLEEGLTKGGEGGNAEATRVHSMQDRHLLFQGLPDQGVEGRAQERVRGHGWKEEVFSLGLGQTTSGRLVHVGG